MQKTVEVVGRNGYLYDATPISGNLYIVGKYIVVVEHGVVQDTVCRATEENLEQLERRQQVVKYGH